MPARRLAADHQPLAAEQAPGVRRQRACGGLAILHGGFERVAGQQAVIDADGGDATAQHPLGIEGIVHLARCRPPSRRHGYRDRRRGRVPSAAAPAPAPAARAPPATASRRADRRAGAPRALTTWRERKSVWTRSRCSRPRNRKRGSDRSKRLTRRLPARSRSSNASPGAGVSATDAPGTDAPGTRAPGIGAPGIGAPGIGAPGIGAREGSRTPMAFRPGDFEPFLNELCSSTLEYAGVE